MYVILMHEIFFLIFVFLSFCVFDFCVVDVCKLQTLSNEWVYHFHLNNLPTAKFTVAFYNKIIYVYHFKKVIVRLWMSAYIGIKMAHNNDDNDAQCLIDSKKITFCMDQIKKFGFFYIDSGIRTWWYGSTNQI